MKCPVSLKLCECELRAIITCQVRSQKYVHYELMSHCLLKYGHLNDTRHIPTMQPVNLYHWSKCLGAWPKF